MIVDILIIFSYVIFDSIVYSLNKNPFKYTLKRMTKLNLCLVYMSMTLQLLSIAAPTNIVSVNELIPSNVTHGDGFGWSIGTDGNFTIIGSRLSDDYGSNSGSVYIFDYNSMEFTKLTPSDSASGDWFGYSVAIFDDIAVVGSMLDDDYERSSGSAYIFQYDTEMETWNQTAKLTASDAAANDHFGYSVGITKVPCDDCYHVIVGTIAEKTYIFRYNSSNEVWNQHTILTPNDTQAGISFGFSVAMYEEFAIVGAMGDTHLGITSGSAYIFRYNESNDSWNQFTKLTASDGETLDRFGLSVAIHNYTAIIGAPRHDHNGGNGGSAYIFKYNEVNGLWIEVAALTSSNTHTYGFFGRQVDIYGDLAVIGAIWSDVYLFEYNHTNGTWAEIVKIIATHGESVEVESATISNKFVAVGSHSNTMYIATVDDLKNPQVTIRVDYNYKTSMDIIGIDNGTDYFASTIDECNQGEILNNTISYVLPVAGCYAIGFYDCDDSVVNDRTDNHGSYEIEVQNVLGGFGGYYFDSETRVICTNNIYNHVSFCITPQFCSNNQQLWTHDESDITMTSYQAMVNSTITSTSWDEIYIMCSGDYSCYNSVFEVC